MKHAFCMLTSKTHNSEKSMRGRYLIQLFELYNLMEDVVQDVLGISNRRRQFAGNSKDIPAFTDIVLKVIFSA